MAFRRSAVSIGLFVGSAWLSPTAGEPLRPPADVAPPAAQAAAPVVKPTPAPVPPLDTGPAASPNRLERPAAAEPKPQTQSSPSANAPAPSAGPPSAVTAPLASTAPASASAAPAPSPAPVKFAAVSNDPRPSLSPETFINTMRAADRLHALAESGGWGVLPLGTTLKLGDKSQLVVRLKERLAASDDLPAEARSGEAFDAGVLAAVKRFQLRHGLPETGLVGPKTIEAMNVPPATRARQLSASAQRLAGTRFPFGDRYVVVNIPSATVEAVERGEVKRRYVAVVGKKERASPSVMARISSINFNPTWTVPVSLIKKDIIPHMRKDAGYLAKMKIRILNGQGQEVDPAKIDWSTEKAANYTLRQDPGASNSLGQIRIDMPNKQAVYMHDTPTKKLFAQSERFHSSGCVRVGDVKAFVAWLLEGTPTAAQSEAVASPWTESEIDAAIASQKRQDVILKKQIPVAWIYMTGFATPDGVVHFRNDVYGLDAEPAPAQPLTMDELITSAIGRKPL